MDQLTLREELAAIDAQIAGYKAGVQARRELEKERYALAKELQRQEYDLKVYYGQLTLAQQEQQLRLMINDYKKGTQARIDLEKSSTTCSSRFATIPSAVLTAWRMG